MFKALCVTAVLGMVAFSTVVDAATVDVRYEFEGQGDIPGSKAESIFGFISFQFETITGNGPNAFSNFLMEVNVVGGGQILSTVDESDILPVIRNGRIVRSHPLADTIPDFAVRVETRGYQSIGSEETVIDLSFTDFGAGETYFDRIPSLPQYVAVSATVTNDNIVDEGTRNIGYGLQMFNGMLLSRVASVDGVAALQPRPVDPVSPVPLPASVWLMLGGFGMIGAVKLRRRPV